jgi:hypothetical protein
MIGVFEDMGLGYLGMFIKFKIYGAQLPIPHLSISLHYDIKDIQ